MVILWRFFAYCWNESANLSSTCREKQVYGCRMHIKRTRRCIEISERLTACRERERERKRDRQHWQPELMKTKVLLKRVHFHLNLYLNILIFILFTDVLLRLLQTDFTAFFLPLSLFFSSFFLCFPIHAVCVLFLAHKL